MKLISAAATLLLAATTLGAAIEPEAETEIIEERGGILKKIIDSIDTKLYGKVEIIGDILQIHRGVQADVKPHTAPKAGIIAERQTAYAASLPDPSDPFLSHNKLFSRKDAISSSEQVCATSERPDICNPGTCCPAGKHACCYDRYGSCIPNEHEYACCTNSNGACRINQICCSTGGGCCPDGWRCAPQQTCQRNIPRSGGGN